jgi:hypothetical protein
MKSKRSLTHLAHAAITIGLNLVVAVAAESQAFPWVGLSGFRAQVLWEEGPGHDGPGAADHFGHALAAGDFNADGADDLAIGVPFNDCDFVVWDCGSVQVRLGERSQELLSPATALRQGALDNREVDEHFGFALAAGDFDGDGYEDLAVGAPRNRAIFPSGTYPTGQVDLHFGNAGGVAAIGLPLRAGHQGVPGTGYNESLFGSAVAFGDFDGDGRDDLAIGAPKDGARSSDGFIYNGGTVTIVALDAEANLAGFEMFLGDQGLPDAVEAGERFGAALATGDWNGDGFDDLAIGVPEEDDTGAVLVVYGSPFSLIYANHWYIGQGDLGEPAEPGDRFGEALAAGDFNDDGFADLAIGAPDEDGENGGPSNTGRVHVVYGSSVGLSTAIASTKLDEDILSSGAEGSDYFGSTLAAGDFDGDGVDDLAIGREGENGAVVDSGAVSIVLGTPSGLLGADHEARPGSFPSYMIPDGEVGSPYYGFAQAAGDFNGDGASDLAIGGPNADWDEVAVDVGRVAVLRGALFADGFEAGAFPLWSRVEPD